MKENWNRTTLITAANLTQELKTVSTEWKSIKPHVKLSG